MSGVSKATVSVEVSWSNAAANDYIVVTSGASSRTITPGVVVVPYKQLITTITGSQTIVSPQVVAFEIDANSAPGLVQARFASNATCLAVSNFVSPAPCPPTACGNGELGGVVYKDYNDNGIREAGESAGVGGVTVKAIACDGTVYNTTTDNYGRYALAVPAAKYPVRVEFSNVPSVYNLGVRGANSGTSVQFIATPSCTADLGVSNPLDYCSDLPRVFIPCYTYGDPLVAGGTSASADAVASIPYGVASSTFQGEQPVTTAAQVGSVWGLAYNKYTKRIFYSAVLKRHTGLGPAGLGGIYVTNYSNPASPITTTFLSVSALGIDVGTIPSNAARGLQGDKSLASHDPDAFSLTAKVGIGGLEVSEDGNTLWLVNLKDGKLYAIDITQYNRDGVTRPTAANVRSFSIPASCVGGTFRPWALNIHNGNVYVGGVCDAQLSANRSNLRASVYELNGSTFTQVFDFPLTYPKGYPAANNPNITGWYPWTDRFSNLIFGDGTSLRYPVPIFTDIDFDVDGSMVLAFGDRTGFQGGDLNYSPTATDTKLYETNSQAGDILRAYSANGTFVLENNAKAGPSTGYGPGNSQGPGFGEFYNDNWLWERDNDILYHAELIMGGLALKPGSGEVVATTIDPVDKVPYSGGVRYFDNATGQYRASYSVYTTRGPGGTATGTFAKATGLGEPELNCKILEAIQIGNRVWVDTNKDGVQDACENPLRGVQVDLYKGTTRIASTTTSASGTYYFASLSSLSANGGGTWFGTGADTTLLPNTAYSVVFGSAQFANNLLIANGNSYRLTPANSTTTNANDQNDSDAQIQTIAGITAPVISVTTGSAGSVDHTLDAGFELLVSSLGDYVFEDVNRDGIQNTGDRPLPGVVVTLYQNGSAVASTTTGATGSYSFTGLTPGMSNSYVVGFSAPAGFTATTPLAGTNRALDSDVSPLTGRTQSLTLSPQESNTTVDAGFYLIPASVGDYVFDDRNANGIQDTGDVPLAGVVVTLYQNGSAISTVTSTTAGAYSFTGLTPGSSVSYSVGFSPPANFTATTPRSGSNRLIDSDADPVTGRSLAFTLTPGESNTTVDAGFFRPGIIGGTVFNDANKDGVQNSGDTPLAGVVVTLYQNGSAVSTVTSTTAGAYSFTGLTPGSSVSYSVGFAPPTNFTTTAPRSGTNTAIDSDADPITGRSPSFTLSSGESNTTVGAGFYALTAGLGDYVFEDRNANGIQDTGDVPLAGVVVTLYQNGSAISTVTSTTAGAYSFTGLTPGTYVVGFAAPAGFIATLANAGASDAQDSDVLATGLTGPYSLSANEFNPTVDAGYIRPAVLSSYVFNDTNKDGIRDAGDTPLAGVVVTLYQNGSVVATTTTQADGAYSFTGLTPGNASYSLGFTPPAGFTTTAPRSGTNTAIDSDADPITGLSPSFTLSSGENNVTIGAGFYPLTASLGDYVFNDVNKNGIQDSGDTPIQGVVVSLLQSGTLVTTTTTNAAGLYSFMGLTPGVPYSVSFATPAGFTATAPNVGDNRAIDSNPVGGVTAPLTLTANETNTTVDAGFYLLSPMYAIAKTVDKNQVERGQVVTYTISLTNTSAVSATNVVVTDAFSTSAVTIVGSGTASAGTFTVSATGGQWVIPSLNAGQVATLRYQVQANDEGLTYNTATAPTGVSATACFTVPYRVCDNTPFEFELAAPAGSASYQWSRNGVPIPNATSATYTATVVGIYSVAVTNASGCPDGSCCPLIIAADPAPSLTAVAVAASCSGPTPRNDASISLVSSNTAAVSYNISRGSSFSASTPLFSAPRSLSAVVNGVLLTDQPNPTLATGQAYTIRVYAASGCYADTVVTVLPAQCTCPPTVCAPFVVRKTRTGGRPTGR